MSVKKTKTRGDKKQEESVGIFSRWTDMTWLTFSASMFVVALLVLSIAKVYQPDTLRFRTIQVFGELQWIQKEKLNQLIVSAINGGFFSLDVKSLKQRLERQAWIRSVSVRRVWPDVLQVVVNEQKPVAVWNNEMLINVEGELFHPLAEGVPDSLVRVAGPAGTHEVLIGHYVALQEMLLELGLQISAIKINVRRAVEITLDNGMRLLLGRVRNETDSSAELARFIRTYGAELAPKASRVDLVDLRYTNGLAVRWKAPANSSAGAIPSTEKTSTDKSPWGRELPRDSRVSQIKPVTGKSNNNIARRSWENAQG